ncbi:unnamed protein product [Psylliodes chrysocephalus]|uniref:Uncharacterized protein n=1 Tax=Psylliodes chrysocephalus TaxID=3402493 RepID=A0A9P0DBB7_9CUCU|nr:unnamed protein product [Psylliodes chrysocephala]
MASIYHFYEEAQHTENLVFESYKVQNDFQTKVNWAATKIQSFFRGLIVRVKLEYDKNAAIVIQKYVRGWLLRYHLPDKLQEFYDENCFKFYNQCAAKIQATWKGYVFRKYTFCIKDVLAARTQIAKGNEEIFQLFKQPFNEFNKTQFEISDDYIREIYEILFDRHHLLRTNHIKGVLSQEGTEELAILEKLIKVMPWQDFITGIHKIYYDCSRKKEPITYKYSDKRLHIHEDFIRYMIKRLAEFPQAPKRQKPKPFILSPKVDRPPVIPILTKGRFVPPIKNPIRVTDSRHHVGCKNFHLHIPHANRLYETPMKSGYRIDFWYEECMCGQRERLQ